MCLLTHQWLYTDHHRSSAMSTWIERNGDSVSLRLAENYRVSGNRKHQNHQCNTLIIRFIQYRTDTILIHTLYFKWQIHTPPPHIHTQTRPEVMIRWWTRWMCATCHFNATTIKSSALLMVFFSFGSNQTTEFYEEEEKEKRAKHSNCSQHNVCHWTGAVSKNQNRKSHDWPNFN